MFGIIVKSNNYERVIISTRNLVTDLFSEMLKTFLRDVYDCDDEEMDVLTCSWKSGTGSFICNNFSGTFKRIDISTC